MRLMVVETRKDKQMETNELVRNEDGTIKGIRVGPLPYCEDIPIGVAKDMEDLRFKIGDKMVVDRLASEPAYVPLVLYKATCVDSAIGLVGAEIK